MIAAGRAMICTTRPVSSGILADLPCCIRRHLNGTRGTIRQDIYMMLICCFCGQGDADAHMVKRKLVAAVPKLAKKIAQFVA